MALATRAAMWWERPFSTAESLFILEQGVPEQCDVGMSLRAGRHIKLALRFSSLKPNTKTLDATGQCYAAKRRAGRGEMDQTDKES